MESGTHSDSASGDSGVTPDSGSEDSGATLDSAGGDSGVTRDSGHDSGHDSGPDSGTRMDAASDAKAPDSGVGCVIGGTAYASGAVDPTNACQSCLPGVSMSAWTSTQGANTGCPAGDVCEGTPASCTAGCWIAGAFVSPGATANGGCEVCTPATSTTEWTDVTGGASCPAGEVCNAGSCAAGCSIGGTFYASGAIANSGCEVCTPGTSTTAWTDVTGGASCPAGEVCNAGSCAAGCFIGGTFQAPGTVDPASSCETCVPGASTTAWTPSSGSLTGFVYDPANNLPVPNALVYVPTGAVEVPQTGVHPAVCGCPAPSAIASTTTSVSGAFTLTGVPSGAAVNVVVQLGKWQGVFKQTITACTANTASNGASGSHLTLPGTRIEGNIPRFAVDTGSQSSLECVLSRIGISTNEFVDPAIVAGVPTAAGRVHFYQGSIYAGGAILDENTPFEDELTEASTVMNAYDVLLFPCQGLNGAYDAANGWPNTLGNITAYANSGGRVLAEHFHYDLIDGNGTGNGSFGATATWSGSIAQYGDLYSDPTYNVDIDTTFTEGLTLAQWLVQPPVYGGTLGIVPLGVVRADISTIVSPAQRWLHTETCSGTGVACAAGASCCSGDCQAGACTAPAATYPPANIPIQYTFNAPFNEAPACGRVAFSDFHAESVATMGESYTNYFFPSECPGGATGSMTPADKVIAFTLFDLVGSCQ